MFKKTSKAQIPLQQWEYVQIKVENGTDPFRNFDHLGWHGWELVTIAEHFGHNVAHFKKPIVYDDNGQKQDVDGYFEQNPNKKHYNN